MSKKLFLLSLCSFASLAVLAQAQTPPPDDGRAVDRAAIRAHADQNPRTLSPAEKKRLLEAREAVWRAYFTNDQAQLDKLIPADTIVLEGPLEKPFVKKAEILESAKQSAQRGAKLVRLEFPQTELQVYGDTAIIYTTYLYELENAQGERHTNTGRATEIFVRRKGAWVNPGWHMTPVIPNARTEASTGANDDRDADRAEIRAHIESIFQAFIDKDAAKLRATHSEDWRGFLEGSRVAIRGVEEYMQAVSGAIKSPNTGLKAYKITYYDALFHGADLAVVCFVADVEYQGGGSNTLRIMDVYAKRKGHWIQAGSHTVGMPR